MRHPTSWQRWSEGGFTRVHDRPRSMPSPTRRSGRSLFPPSSSARVAPGGWLILDEPELHLRSGAAAPDIVVPDIAGWRRERMPALPETAYFEIPPDWICEILSPSTARLDRGEKREIYARESVAHLWLVDPIVRQLEAFELREGRWVLLTTISGSADVAVAPFAAVSFSLGSLWAE